MLYTGSSLDFLPPSILIPWVVRPTSFFYLYDAHSQFWWHKTDYWWFPVLRVLQTVSDSLNFAAITFKLENRVEQLVL